MEEKFDFGKYDYRFSYEKFAKAEDKYCITDATAEAMDGNEVHEINPIIWGEDWGEVDGIGMHVTAEVCVKKKKEANKTAKGGAQEEIAGDVERSL